MPGLGAAEFDSAIAANVVWPLTATDFLDMSGSEIRNVEYLELEEITTPAAQASHGKVYTKTDDNLYFQDGAGVEHEMAKSALFLPLTGGVMSGDIDLNGVGELILDADGDTKINSLADDTLNLICGGSTCITVGANILMFASTVFRDDVFTTWGNSNDARAKWDTAETTDMFKFGITGPFVIGPTTDHGIDRYGGSAPPFGLVIRADDATATNRMDLYQAGTVSNIEARAGTGQLRSIGVIAFSWASTMLQAYKKLRHRDGIGATFGTADDAEIRWDTAETTDMLKVGLPASGTALVIGPVAGLGTDEYAGVDPPFGLAIRADDATALNRLDLYHDGTDAHIDAKAGNLILDVAGSPVMSIESIVVNMLQQIRLIDDKEFWIGTGDDIRIRWDTSETTDLGKLGLPSGGKAFVIGPIGDNGVDRYGASPPPFGLAIRADDATAANRIELYHDGTDGNVDAVAGQLHLRTGGTLFLSMKAASGVTFADGIDMRFGSTTGTTIGGVTGEKLAFWGATPIVQLAKADYNDWAAFGDVVDALVAVGLFDAA